MAKDESKPGNSGTTAVSPQLNGTNKNKNPGEIIADKVVEGEIYRFWYTYWLYQDQLAWNRLRIIIPAQAGVIAVAATKQGVIPILTCLLAAILMYGMFHLMYRDWEIRDYLGMCMEPVHRKSEFQCLPPTKLKTYEWTTDSSVPKLVMATFVGVNIIIAILNTIYLNNSWDSNKSVVANLLR
jgi:hypothetical protein